MCALAPMVHHRSVCTKLHGSTISQSTRNDLQQWQPSDLSIKPSRQYVGPNSNYWYVAALLNFACRCCGDRRSQSVSRTSHRSSLCWHSKSANDVHIVMTSSEPCERATRRACMRSGVSLAIATYRACMHGAGQAIHTQPGYHYCVQQGNKGRGERAPEVHNVRKGWRAVLDAGTGPQCSQHRTDLGIAAAGDAVGQHICVLCLTTPARPLKASSRALSV